MEPRGCERHRWAKPRRSKWAGAHESMWATSEFQLRKLFRLVTNLQHDLAASMTRVGLLQGLGRVSQWKSFGNDDLNFLCIDEFSDLGQLVAIIFSLQRHAPNPIFVQLRLVNAANQTHHDSAFFYDGIGSLQCFAADAINNHVNVFGDILEFLRFVIDG